MFCNISTSNYVVFIDIASMQGHNMGTRTTSQNPPTRVQAAGGPLNLQKSQMSSEKPYGGQIALLA